MTPTDALLELLGRVGACNGIAVLVSAEELHQWPNAAVQAMKSQRLIVKAFPADSAICPGCEESCVMPVHHLPQTSGRPSPFIVCDKRGDINRISVPPERLIQWRCSADLVCEFVASNLGLHSPTRQTGSGGRWELGISIGDRRNQMLCLEASSILTLVAGNSRLPLVEFIEFHDGEYTLDDSMVRRLIDAATTADERYTPSNARREARKLDTQAVHESWRKAYRKLRKKRPSMSDVWYSQQIAKMDLAKGRSAETIRKQMKK